MNGVSISLSCFSTAGDTDNCSDVRELSVFSFLTRSSAFSSLYLKRQINYLFQYQKNHLSDYLQYNCHNQSAKSNIHNLQNLFESFCYFKLTLQLVLFSRNSKSLVCSFSLKYESSTAASTGIFSLSVISSNGLIKLLSLIYL